MFDSYVYETFYSIRLGYVTGPQPLIERIVLHLMVSSMQTSTLSQVSDNVCQDCRLHLLEDSQSHDFLPMLNIACGNHL